MNTVRIYNHLVNFYLRKSAFIRGKKEVILYRLLPVPPPRIDPSTPRMIWRPI